MFVTARVHIATLEALATERAKREVLSVATASLQTQVDWLYLRVNQLEKERAILFRQVTHLPIPVPEIVANPIQTSADHIMTDDLWAGTDNGNSVD